MIPKYHPEMLPARLAAELREHLGLATSSPGLSVSAAARLLRARQLATLWGGSELPSLIELLAGEPTPSKILFYSPAVLQAHQWAQTLVESGEFLLVRLFRRRLTLVGRPLWPSLAALAAFDPEKALSTGEISRAAYHIALVLQEKGPCDRAALGEALLRRFPILPSSVSEGLHELEHRSAIYPQTLTTTRVTLTGARWDLLARRLAAERIAPPEGGRPEAVRRLVRAVVAAAGIVKARDCIQWFPNWRREASEAMADSIRRGAFASLQDGQSRLLVCTPTFERVMAPGPVAATCHLIAGNP